MQTEPRTNEFRLTLIYALVLAVVVAAYKVLPRYLGVSDVAWNLVPMGALALFIGSRLRTWYAYLVPLGASFIADLLIIPALAALGYQSMDISTPFTYLGFVLYAVIGRLCIPEKQLSPLGIGAASLAGSVQFFLVSNFGSWVANPDYPRSLAGLLECYMLGVPFYRNTLVSDLVFPMVFFALHAALLRGLAPVAAEEQPA
jgi:hypothetical protein